VNERNLFKIDDSDIENKLHFYYEDDKITKALNKVYSTLFESKVPNILHYLDLNGNILLYGKTGMGKTSTAYNFMRSHKSCTKYHFNANTLISEKLGKTPERAVEFFETLQSECKEFPTIGLLEEVDTIFLKREDSNELADMKRFLAVFLKYLDVNIDNLILICTTNHIDNIDPAILRRFCFKFEIKQNEQILRTFLTSTESPFYTNFQDDTQVNNLVQILLKKNTSFSEIKYFMRELYLNDKEITPENLKDLIDHKGD